jgi:hypothetical protein
MEKKSDSNKKEQRREDYKKSYSGDLASFTGMYGDSFYHKIDLLGQLIHDTHHPSLGLYKEKLLKEAIEKYIPKKYEIGTGFVVFPDLVPEMVSDKWIFKHKASSQLDIIIYDSFEYPPIFKDNDFVVLRPESVRVIIEVKGSLDLSQLESSLEKFWDYSDKWSACQGNYMSSRIHDVTLPPPIFLMMAWRKSVDTGGILKRK